MWNILGFKSFKYKMTGIVHYTVLKTFSEEKQIIFYEQRKILINALFFILLQILIVYFNDIYRMVKLVNDMAFSFKS